MTATDTARAKPRLRMILREARLWVETGIVVFILFSAFSTVVGSRYYIPSESMQPTLEVGDHIAVAKYRYGFSRWSLPYGVGEWLPAGEGRAFSRVPARGDVVVFRHPFEPRELIKRVIALPGDRVAVAAGRVVLNGQMLPRDFERESRILDRYSQDSTLQNYIETLPNGRRYRIYEIDDRSELDDFPEITIPAGRIFLMGDNRDQSADSRAPAGPGLGPGLVPMEYLVGKAETLLFTFAKCHGAEQGFQCPRDRLWKPLEIKPVPGETPT